MEILLDNEGSGVLVPEAGSGCMTRTTDTGLLGRQVTMTVYWVVDISYTY